MKKLIVVFVLLVVAKSAFSQTYDTAIAVLQPLVMPTKSGAGSATTNYWIQDSSGYVQDSVTFPATRNYRFDFTGRANTYGAGLWPDITIKIDGTVKATLHINHGTTDSIFSTLFSVSSGRHAVRISFTDLSSNGTNKIWMGLLYIFSSNSLAIIKYPAIARRDLPTYGSGFLKSGDFVSGHLRGMNMGKIYRTGDVVPSLGPVGFAKLGNDGANLLRCYVTVERSGSAFNFTAHCLDTMVQYVKRARTNHLYLVVVITEYNNGLDDWEVSAALRQSMIDRARDVATLYKDSTEIAGWALMNEPDAVGTLGLYVKFAQDMAAAIRRIDTNHIIIVPSMVGNGATDINKISEPLPFSNTMYELHFYQPFQITHQGINTEDSVRTEYPNSPASPYYKASYLGAYSSANLLQEAKLTTIQSFTTKYNIPVYVGEFTCVSYAPNWSSTRWVTDVSSIFENLGWAWTNHAFEEYEPWDPEIPSGAWYHFSFTNAFPNVSPSVGIMDTTRNDSSLTYSLLKTLWLKNGNTPLHTWYRDQDVDGYGTSTDSLILATQPAGYVLLSGDCNDSNVNISPGRPEICFNGVDDNCNGQIDENCGIWYQDLDADGWGNVNVDSTASNPPAGYVDRAGDFNDLDSSVNPGHLEICANGIDDNCNGLIDENCPNQPIVQFGDASIYVRGTGLDQANITIELSASDFNPVTVNYATSNGTALSGTDYTAVSGTVTFTGVQRHKTITVPLIRGSHGTTKSFTITLSSPSGAALGNKNPCLVFIYDTNQ